MSGISFDEWGGVDQHQARLMARDPDVRPLALRVMFAAIGWSNLIGHAEFARSGLAIVLQTANPQTGEIHIPSAAQVTTAIRRAEGLGLISLDSSRFCLVAPPWWEKAGGKGGKSCHHHGIASRSQRHKRSVATPAERHTRSVAATHEECRDRPLTCDDVETLYDSVLPPRPDSLPPAERQAS